MSKINVYFNDKNYLIDKDAFAASIADLKSHLSTKMNGVGATINLDGVSYSIDSAKLASATNDFVTHLGAISGSGQKVKVGNIEYSIDTNKLTESISDLEVVLGKLHSDAGDSGEDVDPNAVAFAIYSNEDNSLRFYKRSDMPSVGDKYNGLNVTALYEDIETTNYYVVLNEDGDFAEVLLPGWQMDEIYSEITSVVLEDRISPISTVGWFAFCGNLTTLDLSNLDTSNVFNMSHMFDGCYSLKTLDLSNFNTRKVTDMSWMFTFCEILTSLDLSSFNTSNVTDMCGMFSSCFELTSLDLSNFDTGNVTGMNYMFSNCGSLTLLDLSNFDTCNVTNMYMMFSGCYGLTSLDISNFNTSNVTDMYCMFGDCESLTLLDLGNFDTSNVFNMNNMFANCCNLTSLDISNFDTGNVTDMYGMFVLCGNLTTIYVSDLWDISNVTNGEYMFNECNNIVGQSGTRYNSNNTGLEYANYQTGYLTLKSGDSGEETVNEYGFYFDKPYVGNVSGMGEVTTLFHENGTVDILVDGNLYQTTVAEYVGGVINIPALGVTGTPNSNGTEISAPGLGTTLMLVQEDNTINEHGFYLNKAYANSNGEAFVFFDNGIAGYYISGDLYNSAKMGVEYSESNFYIPTLDVSGTINNDGTEIYFSDIDETYVLSDSYIYQGMKIIIGDYTYECIPGESAADSVLSWRVRVNDKTKSSYGTIKSEVKGLPVTSMLETFRDCTNLTTAPAIPSSVNYMIQTFTGCVNLTGNVEINSNPTSYNYCFDGTVKPITITGSCSDATKAALAATVNNGNVTY